MVYARAQSYSKPMSPQPHEERAVGRLRNDVDDIYENLGVIQGTLFEQSTKLDELDHKTSEHSATFSKHTKKLDHIIELLQTS